MLEKKQLWHIVLMRDKLFFIKLTKLNIYTRLIFFQECPSGRFGHNCEYLCATNYYGRFCVEVCNCSQLQGYYCHHVNGCTKNATGNATRTL